MSAFIPDARPSPVPVDIDKTILGNNFRDIIRDAEIFQAVSKLTLEQH
jgi:hypothetical protein